MLPIFRVNLVFGSKIQPAKFCMNQIARVVDTIGYMRVSNGSVTLLVPKESVNVAGAEAR